MEVQLCVLAEKTLTYMYIDKIHRYIDFVIPMFFIPNSVNASSRHKIVCHFDLPKYVWISLWCTFAFREMQAHLPCTATIWSTLTGHLEVQWQTTCKLKYLKYSNWYTGSSTRKWKQECKDYSQTRSSKERGIHRQGEDRKGIYMCMCTYILPALTCAQCLAVFLYSSGSSL